MCHGIDQFGFTWSFQICMSMQLNNHFIFQINDVKCIDVVLCSMRLCIEHILRIVKKSHNNVLKYYCAITLIYCNYDSTYVGRETERWEEASHSRQRICYNL